MAIPALIIAGAAIAGSSGIKANMTRAPEDINPGYPEQEPVEEQIVSLQLQAARNLRKRIDDPSVIESIYKLLPEAKMSASDRAAFTEEYTGIKKQVAAMGLEQKNSAMGAELDDLVARGVMSAESANKQRIKNEAAINSVLKIYNKRLDASRIGMARGEYLKKAGGGIRGAGVIAEVDRRNRDIYNGVMSGALQRINNRIGSQLEYAHRVKDANIGGKISSRNALGSFNSSLMGGLIPYGQDEGGGGGGGGMDMSFGGGGDMSWMNTQGGGNQWAAR